MTEMNVNLEMERLAVLRGSYRAIEDQNRGILEEIKEIETRLKAYVASTGEQLEGAGLRVATTAGRVTYDGHALFDMAGHLEKGLAAMGAQVWEHSETAPELVQSVAGTLDGMLRLVRRMIAEGSKQGDPVIRISEVKAKKDGGK